MSGAELPGGRAGFFCRCAFLVFLISPGLVIRQSSLAAGAPAPDRADDWQPAPETIVVFNRSFDGSEELANYYASKRNIPEDHLVGLKCAKEETVSRDDFENTIREPLLRKFNEKKWWAIEKRDVTDPNGNPRGQALEVVRQDVRVIVLMRGVPLRVKRSSDRAELSVTDADEASVDSELAALGLLQRPIKGPLENRYYRSTRRFVDHYEARGQFIVGRLDAADDKTVRRMINDSLKAERDGLWGRAVIDFALKDGAYLEGEQWLGNCVKLMREAGVPVFADRSTEIIREGWPLPDTILYLGWYADGISGALASPGFRFKPGAIACHLHSFSAEVLRTKTERWCGPLLEHGAAAVLGNVWEPYLTLTAHFDLLGARLTDGFTLGEAAWSATPALSWMNVVVGDPLYRPFPRDRDAAKPPPADEDYAVFQNVARRFALQDPKKFRREILRLAEGGKNARLLELAGLLSTVEEKFGEAEDFFGHAKALHTKGADRLRCALYIAELDLRRGLSKKGNALIRALLADPKLADTPAAAAPLAMDEAAGAKP
jgi:uncharacterized protein (TIGR03790 family)